MPAPDREHLPENHISASQYGRFRRCAQQDYLYLKHGPMPPGIAQIRGTVTHEVACNQFRRKRGDALDEDGRQLPLLSASDVRDLAADTFQKTLEAEGLRLSDDEVVIGEAMILGDAKDWAVTASEFHTVSIVPQVQPDLVECEVVSEGPLEELGGYYLVGRIDLLDSQRQVRDLKTTAQKGMISLRAADTSSQLTTYALLYQMQMGLFPDSVMLDGLWVGNVKKDGTRSKEYIPARSTRDWADVKGLLSGMAMMVKARESGIFVPVDASGPSGWVCSQKYCGYTGVCPYYRKERHSE